MTLDAFNFAEAECNVACTELIILTFWHDYHIKTNLAKQIMGHN